MHVGQLPQMLLVVVKGPLPHPGMTDASVLKFSVMLRAFEGSRFRNTIAHVLVPDICLAHTSVVHVSLMVAADRALLVGCVRVTVDPLTMAA